MRGGLGPNPRYHISDHISSPNEACKKKNLFCFKGQTLMLVKIDLWIYEFSPVVGAPL